MKKIWLIITAAVLLATAAMVFAMGEGTKEEVPSIHPEELRLEINHQANPDKEPVWFSNNTMGVKGISLKDYNPELTDKWYQVVPVDVSRNGKQSIYLVASCMNYIGTVTVEVNGDEVTTTYSVPNDRYEIYPGEECIKWFTSMDEITADFLANPVSDQAFGKAVSRENDLNGQSIALLFICNQVTYCNPLNARGDSLYGYCESVDSVMNSQAGCMKMLEFRLLLRRQRKRKLRRLQKRRHRRRRKQRQQLRLQQKLKLQQKQKWRRQKLLW